jgi:CRISPR-associated protein Cas8a1/Csx13
LFSRGGINKVLRDAWRQVLPMIDSQRWQLARDLALLALASYSGRAEEGDSNPKNNDQNS